jgi:aminopeptidase N
MWSTLLVLKIAYTNVNAHELAHQWFGDLVTAQSGKHHWLQEGFATYYAASRTRNMEMIISILNYTKQRKLNMLLERIRFRFSMTSSLSFLSKGLGFVCFT